MLAMVRDAIRIGSNAAGIARSKEQFDFIQNAQGIFGKTLAAVFEFGLYGILTEELTWTARTFRGRELDSDVLSRMLKAWIVALHGTLRTPMVRELVRPFEWLDRHAADFFARKGRDVPRLGSEATAFVGALIDNRKNDTLGLAVSFRKKHSLESLIDSLFLATLKEIGRRWSDNRITVADEHMASANLQWTAHRFFGNLKPETPKEISVAVSCVPGDAHALGAELLSLYLEHRGWSVQFLGATMPEEDMLRLLEARRPQAVVVSVRMVAFLLSFGDLVQHLRQRLPGVRILAGGPPGVHPVLSAFCDGVPKNFEECHNLLAEGRNRA